MRETVAAMANNNQTNQAANSKKVFDVMRPGATPASATSRPIIPSRTRVTDPDVSLQRKFASFDPKEKVRLEPPHEDADTSFDTKTPTEPVLDKPQRVDASTSLLPDSQEPEQDTANSLESPNATTALQPNKEQPEPTTEPAAATDKTLGQATPAQAKDAENSGQATLDSIFGSAENHLVDPMKSAPRGKQQRGDDGAIIAQHSHAASNLTEVFLWLLIVIVIAAILNFLLDAGIFGADWNIPHTDFFGD